MVIIKLWFDLGLVVGWSTKKVISKLLEQSDTNVMSDFSFFLFLLLFTLKFCDVILVSTRHVKLFTDSLQSDIIDSDFNYLFRFVPYY